MKKNLLLQHLCMTSKFQPKSKKIEHFHSNVVITLLLLLHIIIIIIIIITIIIIIVINIIVHIIIIIIGVLNRMKGELLSTVNCNMGCED